MAVNVKVAPPPAESQNMCSGCPGHCCRLRVDLTSYDILRITAIEERAPHEFAEAVIAAEDDALAFKSDGGMAKFVLRHRINGWCILFNEKKELSCTIERSKPAICLSYPFSLVDGKSALRANILCPQKNRLMADKVKMAPSVLEDGIWEFLRYQEMVDDWNTVARGDESPEDFLRFAASEMDLERTPLGRIIRKLKRGFRKLRRT